MNQSYEIKEKINNIVQYLKKIDSFVISYSGGFDSSLLAYIAQKKDINKKYICILINTSMISSENMNNSIKFLKYYNINYKIIEYDFTSIKEIENNEINRCFVCKKKMISLMIEFAKKNDYNTIIDGTNISDINDNLHQRPGIKSMKEFVNSSIKIDSPFISLKFIKKDIYNISKHLKLKYQKSDSCLMTRFQYGIQVKKNQIKLIEESENILLSLGFSPVRVRYHIDSRNKSIVRIEIQQKQFYLYIKYQKIIKEKFKTKIGFDFITLDIYGFRTGSFDQN